MVTKDETRKWEFDGKNGVYRKLSCVIRLTMQEIGSSPIFDVKIKVDHPIAGDGLQGATLEKCLVMVAVHDIDQEERNKRLTFSGDILELLGQMKMVPFTPVGAKQQQQPAAETQARLTASKLRQ